MDRLTRYALAFIGPAGAAISQFLLSLLLLRLLSIEAFGGFSVLLVGLQLSTGLWTALFCALLPVLAAQSSGERREAQFDCLFAVNLLASLPVTLLFLFVAFRLNFPPQAGAAFAAYAGLNLLRGFGRALAYAEGRQLRVVYSDGLYCTAILAGCVLLAIGAGEPLVVGCTVLAISAAIGLTAFGPRHLLRQFVRLRLAALREYGGLWRDHTGWTLLGVITTEATTNAHSYIVALFAGPSQFAVIAASALAARPATVMLNALNEYERAQMAREVADGDWIALRRSLRLSRSILVAAWLAAGAAIAAVLVIAPTLVFPAKYDLITLSQGVALWMAVIGVRVVRAPESTMLQAGGAFRPLAFSSVWSAIASIVTVCILLQLAAPIWSILGILIGETVFAWRLWRAAAIWRRTTGLVEAPG